jgi:hypothetical protein
VKAGASQDLGDLDLSQARAEGLKASHQISDEIREPVDGHRQPEKGVRSLFLQATGPGCDGEGTHQEGPGGLGKGPPSSGSKFKDRQARRGRIIGPAMGLDLLHAGVLDAEFFA